MQCPTLIELPPPPVGKTGWPWTEESPPLRERAPNGSPWPRISIVTPSYNQGQFIEETIRSVLLQGYPDLEYIVMDGGSTDESVAVIRKYEKWLTYWHSQTDGGQAAAINEGFSVATGEVLAYLNSDDAYTRGAFSRVSRDYVTSASIRQMWAAYPVENFDGAGVFSSTLTRIPAELLEWIVMRASLHQPGVFWSRHLFRNAGGFDCTYEFAFDRKFFMELIASGHPPLAVHCPPVARFRVHPESKTSRYDHRDRADGFGEEFRRLRAEFEPRLPAEQARQLEHAVAQEAMSAVLINSGAASQTLQGLMRTALTHPTCLGTRFFWGAIRRCLKSRMTP